MLFELRTKGAVQEVIAVVQFLHFHLLRPVGTARNMPGPCNGKKRKQQTKKKQRVQAKQREKQEESQRDPLSEATNTPSTPNTNESSVDQELDKDHFGSSYDKSSSTNASHHSEKTPPLEVIPTALQQPFIHNPGNGPRVRDVAAYLSSFFAAPPSMADPQCAAYTSSSILKALRAILPEEVALVSGAPLDLSLDFSHSRILSYT